MTIEEMREMIDRLMDYCNGWVDCESCPLHDLGYCGNKCWSDFTNNEIVECYRTVFGAETTDADQPIKADAGKARLTLVPQQILWDIAEVRAYGLKKYGSAENWKKVEIERYKDAAFRHFLKYLRNPQGVDEESGISHLKHLACNIAFLCELEKGGENNE